MDFKSQLMEDMKNAMRNKDSERVGVLRFLLSEIKNIEIDEGELDEKGVQAVISRQIKQIRDGIEGYEKAGREDLVEQEEAKIAVLEEYRAEQLSDEELEKIVQEAVNEAEEPNMGQIIGKVMARVQGKADGGRVSQIVKKKLQ